jgi:hypothetical protein
LPSEIGAIEAAKVSRGTSEFIKRPLMSTEVGNILEPEPDLAGRLFSYTKAAWGHHATG